MKLIERIRGYRLVRDFDTLTLRQKRIAAFASLPIGIVFVMGMDYMGGVSLAFSIRNLCIFILASLAFSVVVQGLRKKGIDLWKK